MERDKITRKRKIIVFLTITALFFWYLPQIHLSRQIQKEQEKAVHIYVREKKENKSEKNEEDRDQKQREMDQNLFRTVDFAALRLKNREICAWLSVPGCSLDTPVVRGQDDTYYLTHNAFGEERIYGSIFVPYNTPGDFSERHTILYGHNMRNGMMFGGLKKYRETSFEQKYPYLYLYLPGETWRFCIFSIEETDAKSDVYRIGEWSETDWNAWIRKRQENNLAICGGFDGKIQKVLTLSTCIGDGSTSQRLAVHAAMEEIFAIDSGREKGSMLE